MAKFVTKGRQVLVEGRVQAGGKGRLKIIADLVRFGKEETASKNAK